MAKATLSDRFWEKVDKRGPNDCWLWTATKTSFGYGSFRMGSLTDGTRRKEMAHRIAYTLATGEQIPKGKVVMHFCDNPTCVNPAHLSIGTYSENGKAAYDRNRRVSTIKPGEDSPRAKLTVEQVEYIRAVGKQRTLRDLAVEFNVSRSTIDAVKRGVNWKEM